MCNSADFDKILGKNWRLKISNKKQTQPANLEEKMFYPNNEEIALIEKLRLEVINSDNGMGLKRAPFLKDVVKYFIKEEKNDK